MKHVRAALHMSAVFCFLLSSGCGNVADRRRAGDDIADTEHDLEIVGLTVLQYRRDRGSFPAVNRDVISSIRGAGLMPAILSDVQPPFSDRWGTEVTYEVAGDSVTLTSAGPDKAFGTDDDIARSYMWPDSSGELDDWLRWQPERLPPEGLPGVGP